MLKMTICAVMMLMILAPVGAASADTASHEDVATVATGGWTGPNPQNGPGPNSIAGQTYADDLNWPNDSQPYARPVAGGSGLCADKSRSYRVKTYQHVQGEGSMPLRCGRWSSGSGWGWLKLDAKNRWNVWFDGMIGATLQNPRKVEVQGTSKVYKTEWFEWCDPVYRFIVVVETSTYGDGKRGIITAYQKFQ